MKILHLVGHMQKWNLESHFQNNVGNGFIFCAYSFPHDFLRQKSISGINTNLFRHISFLDLQYFGKGKSGELGKLSTYPFHPAKEGADKATNLYFYTSMIEGITYQQDLGLRNIIIPLHYENDDLNTLIVAIKMINVWLKSNRKPDCKYYMTVPFGYHIIIDAEKTEKILNVLTEVNICFDGYYIIGENRFEYRQKLNIDFKIYNNLTRVFKVLKEQEFELIYAYANWDALLYLSLVDIDYITIGSFENLRNFNSKRFIEVQDGGPSKGWYFSEKLLNMVKAQFIALIRIRGAISIIKNEKNIFSDAILNPLFEWNNQKPEVHKNYFVAIARLLNNLASIENLNERKVFLLELIREAKANYLALENKQVYLSDESKNYHLDIWESFLLSK